MPVFSVIMNCLNGERYLREALDSVLNQTFTDWEVIFYDSGSKDASIEIAASYGDRVRIVSIPEPVPLGQARQAAIEAATGDYLAFLDVDDIWLPHKLKRQYEMMQAGNFDICYGASEFINEAGEHLYNTLPVHHSGRIFENYLRHVEGAWCTFVIDREKLLAKGTRFNPEMRSSSEEDLVLRFLAYDGQGGVTSEILAKYRVVPGSVTSFYASRLADERFMTLSSLAEENPDIMIHFPRAYAAAVARGHYYKAKYYLEINDPQGAANEMWAAVGQDKTFLPLWLLSKVPSAWKFLHRFKGHLSQIWLHIHYLKR